MMNKSKFMRRVAGAAMVAGAVLCGLLPAGAQVANSEYKGTSRDPFKKYKPPVRRKVEKKTVGPVEPPPVQARIEQYKQRRQEAMNAQAPIPKPTTALLLKEVQVTGIFRTPRGYAAMVEATPIKLSYTIYPGEPFFDGMLVAIEESRLVFRRETLFTDGKRQVSEEIKPLRQPTASDALTTPKESAAAPGPSDGKEEKSANKEEKSSEAKSQ